MEFRTKSQALIFLRDAGRDVIDEVIETLRCDPLNTMDFSDDSSVDEKLSELREVDFSLLKLAINEVFEDYGDCEEDEEEEEGCDDE